MIILAGIVLFNPNLKRLKENIEGIINQVDKIVIVENGSDDSKTIINYIKMQYPSIEIIANKDNCGIAAALNQIIEYGIRNSYEWVVTLDQDSVAPHNMIFEYQKYFHKPNVAIICPQIVDVNMTYVDDKCTVKEINSPEEVITSGSCINIHCAKYLGGFDERLFIDYVDTDFQKRVLLSGYLILKVFDVKLLHEVGHLEEKRFLGFKVLCSNHSAFRRYYQVRNRLYYRKKYYGHSYLMKEMIRLIMGTLKILFYENEKLEKVKSTVYGFIDYKSLLNSEMKTRIHNRS